MNKFVLVLALLLLVGFTPTEAWAQYTQLGRNPVVPGGYTDQQAAQMGWHVFRFDRDTRLTMGGASGEWVRAFLPKGTRAAARPDGTVVLLDCGNPTDLHVIFRDRVQTRTEYRDRVTEVERQVPIYVVAPTVYPTAPMPQPLVHTTVNQSSMNFNVDTGRGSTTNLFAGGGTGGAGGASNAFGQGGSSINWNDNNLEQQQGQSSINENDQDTNNINQNGNGNAGAGTNNTAQNGTNVGQQRQ